MITPAEAEKLARHLVLNYCQQCDPGSPADLANVLMKLVSVASVTMTANVGPGDTAERLEGTAAFIRSNGDRIMRESRREPH